MNAPKRAPKWAEAFVNIRDVYGGLQRNGQRPWQRPISYQDVALCLCSMFISLNEIKIKYSMHQYSILIHILGNWLIAVGYETTVATIIMFVCD